MFFNPEFENHWVLSTLRYNFLNHGAWQTANPCIKIGSTWPGSSCKICSLPVLGV
ncbi:hypothetical protein V6Z12_D11G160300 [Gossypium hirsutum]